MNSNQVLCSNLTELVKKLVLTFCEVNVKFSQHLDIYGSIHIRADDADVASMLLNEHCIKDTGITSSNETINIHVSDDQGNASSKGSFKTTSVVTSEPHFTKVIHSDASCSSLNGQQQMAVNHASSNIMQSQRCPLPPLPPNMFSNPMYLDVCNNSMGMPMNDPYRFMGFVQNPVPMPTNVSGDHQESSMASDLKGSQENFISSDFRSNQSNFINAELKTSQENYISVSSPKSAYSTPQSSRVEQLHLGEEEVESNTEDSRHEMSATESAIPLQHTDYESDVTMTNTGASPWQHEQGHSQPDAENDAAPLSTSTPINDSDSDSAQDTSSSQGGVTYRCRICRKTFSDMKVYSHHVSQCKYQCSHCTKTFSGKQAFDTHMHEEHSQSQGGIVNNNNIVYARGRYNCKVCDQPFKSKAALNGHMTFRHRRPLQQKSMFS